jgi:hypothetical protein
LATKREWIKNPPEQLVSNCCKNCPLFPSKPGQENVPQAILAAANSASRLQKLVDGKLAPIIFGPDDLSARRVAAYFGLKSAEGRSDKNRFKKEKEKPKVDYID